MTAPAPPPGTVSLLVVCTANRCRSPLAAAALRSRATQAGLSWTVGSAGVRARAGDTTEPAALAALADAGLPAQVEPARRLDVATVGTADLVLTAERAHRSAVLDLVPALVGRVFTLLELERLLLAAPAPDAAAHRPRSVTEVAAWAEAARWRAGPGGDADDLVDPLGGPPAAFRACLQVVDRVAARLVAAAVDG